MCARYAIYCRPEELIEAFGLASDTAVQANYNVCPTDMAPIVLQGATANELKSYQFGLLPKWAEFEAPHMASRFVNARAETVLKRPLLRTGIHSGRCLVVANGWYEWTGPKGGKQPWYLHRGGAMFAFAGLSDNGSFSIITVPASPDLEDIHDRMPLLLDEPLRWLSDLDEKNLARMLRPPEASTVERHRVAKTIGNVRATGPQLIAPI